MNPVDTDQAFLRQALELARAGIGLASPNPCVGALIVDDSGRVIGSGTHTYDGLSHAEIIALEQAGKAARGATLYLNLEPCSHQGRTGPCADAIIATGVRRVVACMQDPNPQVSGKGFERLRNAGVSVASGILQEEARELNEPFAKYIRTRTPLVTLKAAMTLDGKIAPPASRPGQSSGWITSQLSRQHVQELRHCNDAILVGAGTVEADDPLLTDRSGHPRRRPLLRVVLDSRLRIPLESKVVKTANDDVLVVCSFAEENRKKDLRQRGVRVEQVAPTGNEGRPDIAAVMRLLGELQITSVLFEGGALINGNALSSGVVDKVFLYYAPQILAGTESLPFATGAGFFSMREAPRAKRIRFHHFEDEFAVEGYLRDPYGEDKI
jgi:diaminohydroxyphosphoribosylaminopyrimidine deaminase/5-amino-6-(5-phosphoribosylamino)uracil reductase